MSNFTYSARDKNGTLTTGTVEALDQPAAVASLIDKGLSPLLVKPQTAGKGLNMKLDLKFLTKHSKVKAMDKVVFSRQFATMINAGVPISQSLYILSQQSESAKLKEVAKDLGKKVEGGSTLAKALADHPDVFSPVYINIVKAGESGGILDQVLDRLATQQEKDAEIVGKVKAAMVYPSVITGVTIAAFIFLMTAIVPKLAVVFESLGSELPVYTKVMLAISQALTRYGIFLGAGLAVGVFLLRRFIKTPAGKRIFDTFLLKLPIIGKILAKVNIARFARTFASLMSSGLGIVESLTITSASLSNSVFQTELLQVAGQVKNGKSMAASLKETKHFPGMVTQMAAVGEETGQVDTVLTKVAEFYEKEVDRVIASLTSVIEPILILVLGVMVGAVVISVFGPISNLTESIQS